MLFWAYIAFFKYFLYRAYILKSQILLTLHPIVNVYTEFSQQFSESYEM